MSRFCGRSLELGSLELIAQCKKANGIREKQLQMIMDGKSDVSLLVAEDLDRLPEPRAFKLKEEYDIYM